MHDRAERDVADAERQHVVGVRVDDGHHLGVRFVDPAVDEALAIELFLGDPLHVAVEVVNQDVVLLDDLGTARARHEVRFGIVGVADADVPVRVENAFEGEDVVREHELAEETLLFVAHGASFAPRLAATSR